MDVKTYFKNTDGSFIISHILRNENYSMEKKHFHDNYEMYFLIAGDVNYFIKDRIYKVGSGDLVLTDANILHKTTTKKEITSTDRIVIQFDKSFISVKPEEFDKVIASPFRAEYPIIRASSGDGNYIKGAIYKIIAEVQRQDLGFEVSIQASLMQLLVYLNRYFLQNSFQEFEHPSPMHQKISEIVKYINQNYWKHITLTELSKMFFISTFYLTKIFKEYTGFTLIDYINNVRVKESQRLLLNTDKKVIEIAEEVGFGSISQFGRAFKAISGISPLQFRLTSK